MFAGVQPLDDLVGMQRGWRHQEDRIQFRMCKQILVIAVKMFYAELVPRPFQFAGYRAAGRDQFRTQRPVRKVKSMALSHASDAGDAQTKRSVHHASLPGLTRSTTRSARQSIASICMA